MPQLHQIQLAYVPVEDRALLRVSTTGHCEYRFWITRRYARMLWPALTRSLLTSRTVASQNEPGAQSAVLAFKHEAALANSDFKTPYQSEKLQTPLGREPIVLARIHCRRLAENQTLLALHPQQGQGLELQLDDRLLHSLAKLLQDAACAGDWDLDLVLSPDVQVENGTAYPQGRH